MPNRNAIGHLSQPLGSEKRDEDVKTACQRAISAKIVDKLFNQIT